MPKPNPFAFKHIFPTKWHQETHHVRKTIRSSSSSFSVKLCLQRSIWLAATSCLGVWVNSAGLWELCTWQNIATTGHDFVLWQPSAWLVFVAFQFVLAKLAQSFCELGFLAFQTFLNYWHFQLFVLKLHVMDGSFATPFRANISGQSFWPAAYPNKGLEPGPRMMTSGYKSAVIRNLVCCCVMALHTPTRTYAIWWIEISRLCMIAWRLS